MGRETHYTLLSLPNLATSRNCKDSQPHAGCANASRSDLPQAPAASRGCADQKIPRFVSADRILTKPSGQPPQLTASWHLVLSKECFHIICVGNPSTVLFCLGSPSYSQPCRTFSKQPIYNIVSQFSQHLTSFFVARGWQCYDGAHSLTVERVY